MNLYSARHLGSKPRINEEITPVIWKGIVNLLEKMEQRNYFAEEYPDGCPDNPSIVCGVDSQKLNDELQLFTGLSWKLKTTHQDDNDWMSSPIDWNPNKYQAFDVIEFLYLKTSTPVQTGQYHRYHEHYHLTFQQDNVAKNDFSKALNDLFSATGMIYEFDQTTGQVKTILGEETKQLIHSALNQRMLDSEYYEMLHDACGKISSSRLEVSYQALEKLWDAFERLKCYFDPQNQKEKKQSIQQIVGLFAENILFQQEVNDEMNKLTDLGNSFRIRHSETYQSTLNNHRQINYLFKRCLAMIVLLQDQILVSN